MRALCLAMSLALALANIGCAPLVLRALATPPVQPGTAQAPLPAATDATAASQQPEAGGWGRWVALGNLLFTAALVIFAFTQWRTHVATLRAEKIISRAYLTISPLVPGIKAGFDVLGKPPANRVNLVTCVLRITNIGSTPCRIVSMKADFFDLGEPLPTEPPINSRPDEEFDLHVGSEGFHDLDVRKEIPSDEMMAVRSGKASLYLLARISYVDRFETLHHLGYGRLYVPNSDDRAHWLKTHGQLTDYERRINLTNVTVQHYNYDKPSGA